MAIQILRFDMRAPAFSAASAPDLYAAALEMAAWADEKGFDSITISEHHATDDGFLPSPLALAGCMAGRTRRIRIGIGALLLPLHDPVEVAEDLAVLDLASGGRVAVTAGLGYRPEEYAMFGRDWETRGRRMDACLEVLQKAWTGEPFEFEGRRCRVTPRPQTRPHPPLLVGGMGRNAARRAARFGLPYQPAVNDPELFAFYQAECERQGTAPVLIPPGSGTMTWISEDPDRSWAEIGPHLLHDATTYAGWQRPGARSAVHSDAQTVDELRAEGKYRIVTPEVAVAEAKESPFAVFLLFPLCGGTPPDLAWQGLELYANQVQPHL